MDLGLLLPRVINIKKEIGPGYTYTCAWCKSHKLVHPCPYTSRSSRADTRPRAPHSSPMWVVSPPQPRGVAGSPRGRSAGAEVAPPAAAGRTLWHQLQPYRDRSPAPGLPPPTASRTGPGAPEGGLSGSGSADAATVVRPAASNPGPLCRGDSAWCDASCLALNRLSRSSLSEAWSYFMAENNLRCVAT